MSFKGTIDIDCDRILLRKFKAGDEVDMFKNYCNDSEVTKYVSWRPHGTIENTKMFLQNTIDAYEFGLAYRWAIVLKETNEVIGSIDAAELKVDKLRASLGYVLGKEYWGKGIMTEAGKAVVNHLFNEGFVRIEAYYLPENVASGKVMEKIGMTKEGILKSYARDNVGHFLDVVMYSIVKNI